MLTSVSVYHVETHYIYTQPRGVIPVPHDVTNIRTFFYNQTLKEIFFA